MKILAIIPAYNEEKSILKVIQNLKENCPEADYIVINDCSRDNTKEVLEKNGLHYVSLPINLGIGGAVQTGYKYAVENDYDIAVQIDGDGQHDTSYLRDLIKPIIEKKADMSIGSRFINKEGFQSSTMRRTGIRIIKSIIFLLSGVKIEDTTSGFRATSKELNVFFSQNYASDYPEPEAILASVLNGFCICEVPVKMNPRTEGKSSIRPIHSGYYMLKVILAILLCRISIRKKRR